MPAGATYNPIQTITLNNAISSVTFLNVPQSYTDLICILNGRTNADANIGIQLNNDTANNYSMVAMYADGTTLTSTQNSNTNNIGAGGISSASLEQGSNIVQVYSYTNTNVFKSVITRANNSTFVQARTGLWRSTSAISSITFTADGTTFVSGTTFNLYGVTAA